MKQDPNKDAETAASFRSGDELNNISNGTKNKPASQDHSDTPPETNTKNESAESSEKTKPGFREPDKNQEATLSSKTGTKPKPRS